MTPRLILFLLLLSIFKNSHSQNVIKSNAVKFPSSFVKVHNSIDSFVINTPYYIAKLILNNDSTFMFYQASPAGYKVCRGYFIKSEKLLQITADSAMSQKLVNDSLLCVKFFRFKKPLIFKPQPEMYYFTKEGIESLSMKFDKIELLPSMDLVSKHEILDSLVSIQYFNFPFKQEKIVIKRLGHNDLVFKKDSIWGFRIYRNGDFKTYRVDPMDLKWSIFPGILIEQIAEGFIVYSMESSSKNKYYYFSTTLNAPAFLINHDHIKKEYAHIPCFTSKIKKTTVPVNYGQIDAKTKNLRIIDLYTECIPKTTPPDKETEEVEEEVTEE